ncbi:unnamed protein product [Penicillium roqueforti FM164]|uniref:Str. FM013 n=2 Tax=Penicillium TaxID=5073 RepID=A0A0G4PYG0_PENC3|nr:unnamed protein product [Penicillium roqueforti FM164]CRL31416.1 unnamed protein product [Penicillium camemberti]
MFLHYITINVARDLLRHQLVGSWWPIGVGVSHI